MPHKGNKPAPMTPPPPPKLDKEDFYNPFDKIMKNKKSESLKIVPRKYKANFRKRVGNSNESPWTQLLIEMAKIQVEAMKAGQKTARKHLIAIMKELEMHVGFRYIAIDEDYTDDPRKG